jgi:hypothetical protein
MQKQTVLSASTQILGMVGRLSRALPPLLALALAAPAHGAARCGYARSNSFCVGVTWNASLPLPPTDLDAAAQSDWELALGRLGAPGGAAGSRCLEAWKGLQCASKFPKCSAELPAQRVCRSLCVAFAVACNGSDAVLARCADEALYSAPPCTDYAEAAAAVGRVPLLPLDAAPAAGAPLPPLDSSPVDLFRTAAGLPLLLALLVLGLHAACCTAQLACGGNLFAAEPEEGARSARDAVRDDLARSGLRAEEAPLKPGGGADKRA